MTLILLLLFTITTSLLQHTLVNTIGSSSTIAVAYNTTSPAICGIIAGEPTQRIQCYKNGETISVHPNVSFQAICGGKSFFCGLRSDGFSVFCWDTTLSSFQPRRIYHSNTIRLTDLTVGDDHVCAREVNSGIAKCWRGGKGSTFPSPGLGFKFKTLTSGNGFTCGILRNNSSVYCWGNNDDIADEIQSQFSNSTMLNLVAGETHACGLNKTGFLVCKGRNEFGQLQIPFSSAFEYSGVSLGSDFSCGIKQRNGLITCWGDHTNKFGQFTNAPLELIVAGFDFICGLTTNNLSIICSGSGWSDEIPVGRILPGPCLQSSCTECGLYPDSEALCGGVSRNICKSCQIELPIAVPLAPKTLPTSRVRNKLSLAFVIVGSVGAFAGFCTVIYCLITFLCRKPCNSVQPSTVNSVAAAAAELSNTGTSITTSSLRSYSTRRYGSSRRLGRQRSESSSKHADRIHNFCLSELIAATENFSLANKIGAGSFGTVYKGRLADGRRVAIKRGETGFKTKKFQDQESAFDSELALLSRLHHKHLVDLIGFCDEGDERLLVYEYMSNGALHDHLHNKNNVAKNSSFLNSWKVRIKIALDAARGIEYLHNYAVPPIIHRDIKSSNILLAANWTARVSDFGLSLMGPESDSEFMSTKAVGTVGYIDPEYYVLNELTAKSDIYGLGVVLLELLTGKKALFKSEEEEGGGTIGVAEYAKPHISAGELHKVLDKRVGSPEIHETEAVELMAYTAMRCVMLEGKDRPNIVDIVANLERALAMCEKTPASLSLNTFSILSD